MANVALLTSVGFAWVKHPHRMHTMRVGADVEGGIEVVGGPWTTGARAKDTIDPAAVWTEVEGVSARSVSLGTQRAAIGLFSAANENPEDRACWMYK